MKPAAVKEHDIVVTDAGNLQIRTGKSGKARAR